MRTRLDTARLIALLLPLALLAGAWGSQIFGHLYPCEMCHWQRWPHYAAVVVAAVAFVIPGRDARRVLVIVAGLLIGLSGAIGLFHAGVEYHWWHGITACTATYDPAASTADLLKRIMTAPVVRCDVPQWTLFGISLAGYNAIISLLGAIVVLAMATRRQA